MEEKAKSALKSALSFLKGDVLFYLSEAEKHETDTTEKLRIHLIKEAAAELSERIKTATERLARFEKYWKMNYLPPKLLMV